jgi:hypothetical protein
VHASIERYLRSDRFPDCLRLMLDRGAAQPVPARADVPNRYLAA